MSTGRSGAKPLHRRGTEGGFSLIELLVTIALFATLAGIALLGSDSVSRSQASAGTRTLLADLQKARLEAMTRASTPNSRGFGVRITPATYTLFEFVDLDGDGIYDGPAEEVGSMVRTLANGMTVVTDLPVVIVFGRQGIAAWTGRLVLNHPRLAQNRCIEVQQTSIRDGIMNGGDCVVQ